MARIRSIHPGLSTDESYMSMTMACKGVAKLSTAAIENRRSRSKHHVYVVCEGCDGPCKVGIASNAAWRLVDLQVGNPRKLILFAAYETRHRSISSVIEATVLSHFRTLIVRGEWVDCRPGEVVNFIDGFMDV